MSAPPLVVTRQVITAAHTNAIRNFLLTWGANVDANGNTLTNAAQVSATSIEGISSSDTTLHATTTGNIQSVMLQLMARQGGVNEEWNLISVGNGLGAAGFRVVHGSWTNTPSLTIASVDNTATFAGTVVAPTIKGTTKLRAESTAPTVELYETGGPADKKLWKVYADNGQFSISCANDADTLASAVLLIDRTTYVPSLVTVYTSVDIVKGTSAGLAYPTGTWAARIFNQTDAITQNGLVVGNRWAASTSIPFMVVGLYDNGNGADTFFKVDGTGKITAASLPGPYATNADAVSGGCTSGMLYRDSNAFVKQVL